MVTYIHWLCYLGSTCISLVIVFLCGNVYLQNAWVSELVTPVFTKLGSYSFATSDCSRSWDVGVHCSACKLCVLVPTVALQLQINFFMALTWNGDTSYYCNVWSHCLLFLLKASCSGSDVRLVGGGSAKEGRVEVCRNGYWGTICNNLWSTVDATVVCRQLGYSTSGKLEFPLIRALILLWSYDFSSSDVLSYTISPFGFGSGPIHFSQIQCNGNEQSLTYCSNSTDVRSCDHSQDVGVRCRGTY